MIELAPLVLSEADATRCRASIVDRLAEEVVALARAALARLELDERAGRGPARRRPAPGGRRAAARRDRAPPARGRAAITSARPRRRRSSAPRCLGSTSSGRRRGAQARSRAARSPSSGRRGARWRTSASSRRPGSTRAPSAPAVDALDLHIADGEFMVLVGPSGSARRPRCGCWRASRRSTRAILIGGRDVTDVPAKSATSRWCSRTTRSTRT